MKRPRAVPAEQSAIPRWLPWILVSALVLLFPNPTPAEDIEVSFQEITVLDENGLQKTEFYPGEEIRVRVQLRVLRSSGNPFDVRLRIAGDGWHEIPSPQALVGEGIRTVIFGGGPGPRLYTGGGASPGKVSLLLDVVSGQGTVALLGRRHAFLTIRCPEGLPEGESTRFEVGATPSDMALTADRRYLYVTSREDRRITVIDAETKTGRDVPDPPDPDIIGMPMGVAPSPGGQQMLVVDAGYQVLHFIDVATHVIQESVALNAEGELGRNSLGDLAVNAVRNEAYIADSRGLRIVVFDLASRRVAGQISLVGLPPSGAGPVQVLQDPDNPRFLYVLCGASNEVIKLDVSSGGIADFVQLRNIQDPSTLWPVWSMALNRRTNEIYVVGNPGGTEEPDPTLETKIYVLPKNRLDDPGRREFRVGTSIWDLVPWEDGRFAYGIDSYRGEILILDMRTGTDLTRCAIPARPGGRHLRADFSRNRFFVGGWLAGFADIVE